MLEFLLIMEIKDYKIRLRNLAFIIANNWKLKLIFIQVDLLSIEEYKDKSLVQFSLILLFAF